MIFKSWNDGWGSRRLVLISAAALLLICVGMTSGSASNTHDSRSKMFSPAIGNPASDDLASDINTILKIELEKEFGSLIDEIAYDKKEIYGRVISINYQLPEGKRLDDTWGSKVVAALSRLGITAVNEGDEVRADGQEIAGRQASSLQLTTAREVEDPDVIGFTAMFMEKRN